MANSHVDLIGWTLIHFLWEGAIVAAALWVALRRLSKRTAVVRYGVCGVGLALLALGPAVTLVVLALQSRAAAADQVVYVASFAEARKVVAASGGSAHMAPLAPALEAWLPTFVAIWAIGVALLSLRLLASLFFIERLKRRFSPPAPTEWQERLKALAQRLAIHRPVMLAVSQRVGIPSTIGVFRAFVILPVSIFTKMSPEQIEVVLVHELAHVARHDYLVNLLQSVLETVLFYHPAVWWVSHMARVEREHCCDDVVVRVVGGRAMYAQTLTQLEERRAAPSLSLLATGGPLMNRIRRIMGLSSAPLRPSAVVAAAVLLLGTIVLLGSAMQARASASDQKPTQKSQLKSHKKRPLKKVVVVRKEHKTTGTTQAGPAARIMLDKVSRNIAASTTHATPIEGHYTRIAAYGGTVRPDAVVQTAASTGTPSYPMAPSPDGRIHLDAQDAPFGEVVRSIGKQSGMSYAIAPGTYPRVTLNLNGVSYEQAVDMLTFASGTQTRIVNGVYHFCVADKASKPDAAEGENLSSNGPLQFKNAKFADAVATIAHRFNISAVVRQGSYQEVDLIVQWAPLQEALRQGAPQSILKALCSAGHATYTVEEGFYVFMPGD
jgi:beta-lactamase regulating signal transducer with metallopeptidase domain